MSEDHIQSIIDAKQLVRQIIEDHQEGEPIDGAQIVQEHPEIADCHSALMDLVLEQFCTERDNSSEADLDIDDFAAQFPDHKSAVFRMLHVVDLFQQAEPEWPRPKEEFLEHYYLEEELGKGSFSRVFLARQRNLGDRGVVVKICVSGAAEANLIGGLKHPNIAEIHSVERDAESGLTAICMPFVTDQTLLHVIDTQKTRTEADRLRLLQTGADLAGALAYLHDQDVLHGDVKPSNVLMTEDRPVLIDFNLSAGPDAGNLMIGGSPAYMSPEQLALLGGKEGASPDDCGFGSDVYSLAATLYHAWSGRLPWGDLPRLETPEETARHLFERCQAGAPALAELCRDIPREVSDAIQKCMSVDPAQRLTAQEFADVLGAAIPTPKPIRSGRQAFLIKALVGGLLLAVSLSAVPLDPTTHKHKEGQSPKKELPKPKPLPVQIQERLADEDYQGLRDLLGGVKERTGYQEALSGFCHVQLMDAANPRTDLVKAISCFQRAIDAGHQPKLMRENIGACRILILDSREPSPEGRDKVPAGPKEAHAALQMMNARVSDPAKKHLLDLDLVEAAAHEFAQESAIQLEAARAFMFGTEYATNPAERSHRLERMLEYLWKALSLGAKIERTLGVCVRFCPSLKRHVEFQKLHGQGGGVPVLSLPVASANPTR